jgi:hypothetical protein
MYDGTNPQLVGMDINFLEQVLDALNIRAG